MHALLGKVVGKEKYPFVTVGIKNDSNDSVLCY